MIQTILAPLKVLTILGGLAQLRYTGSIINSKLYGKKGVPIFVSLTLDAAKSYSDRPIAFIKKISENLNYMRNNPATTMGLFHSTFGSTIHVNYKVLSRDLKQFIRTYDLNNLEDYNGPPCNIKNARNI